MNSVKDSEWAVFDGYAGILKALAHPVRLMIVQELLKNPRCVTAIHEILDVRQPNVSQHLNILKNSGVVGSDRDGAYRCYYLKFPDMTRAILKALGTEWEETVIDEVRSKFKRALELRNRNS